MSIVGQNNKDGQSEAKFSYNDENKIRLYCYLTTALKYVVIIVGQS